MGEQIKLNVVSNRQPPKVTGAAGSLIKASFPTATTNEAEENIKMIVKDVDVGQLKVKVKHNEVLAVARS